MKIEKLMTLSQFVNKCEYQTDIEMSTSYMDIVKYNNFLKQPLKKEMFVNELKKPSHPRQGLGAMQANAIYENIELPKWQEAEKKVIFEGFKYEVDTPSIDEQLIVYNDGNNYLYYDYINKYWRLDIISSLGLSSCIHFIHNLHDLAEATNGELTLKNVEL